MAGQGLETATADDIAIPFLTILQQMSPQCSRGKAEYIKEAEPGFILNTVTQEVFPALESEGHEGILVCPAMYDKKVLEWRPRDSGGGLVAIHEPEDAAAIPIRVDDRGHRFREDNGNVMNTTGQYYVLLEDYSTAMIAMTSSQLRTSRTWNSIMQLVKLPPPNSHITPPIFSRLYRLKTVYQENDMGNWYGWKIENAGWVKDKQLFQLAREFHDLVLKGISIKLESYEEAARQEPGTTPSGASPNKGSDEVPF